eukprot:5127546-Pyramimonas_sp.AAC.1
MQQRLALHDGAAPRAMWARSLSYSTGNRPLQTSPMPPPKLQPMRTFAQNPLATPHPSVA